MATLIQHAQEVTPQQLRKALGCFVSGVTIVTTTIDDEVHGMTANAFTSVSLQPPLVLVSIATTAKMDDRLRRCGRYGVSILAKEQEALSLHFAGARLKERVDPRFQWRAGVPLIEGALVHLACTITDSHPAGDHTLHVGHVDGLWHEHGRPLVFYTGSFHPLDVQGDLTWEL
jgi:flavin reductase (DIM6/NTAB) family NADH-FMN oxidoreductase RutF